MDTPRNHHHLFWEKRKYTDSVSRTFRNHPALIIYTPVELHQELHANLLPPPKPRRELMLGAISLLSEFNGTGLDGLESMIYYFDSKTAPEAPRIAEHLYEQLGYLSLGVENGEAAIHRS